MLQILIVDDVREDLILAESALRQCKILNPIALLPSGDDCIRFFADPLPETEPCLVFLDLAMHPIAGPAVLETVAKTPLGRESLFVMLSGIQDIKSVREGYQLGAKTFFIKPLQPVDVMTFLQSVKDQIAVRKQEGGYVLGWARHSVRSDAPLSPKDRQPIGSLPT